MKKGLFLLSLVLFSCADNASILTNEKSLAKDLNSLMQKECIVYDDTMDFYIDVNTNKREDLYQYTVDISYKNIELNDIRIICIPENLSLSQAGNKVANLGYDQTYNLTKDNHSSSLSFHGYSISYLAKEDQVDVKIYIGHHGGEYFVKYDIN